MRRSQNSLSALLFAAGLFLVGLTLWLLRQSHCAADLKQRLGDIESALGMESEALIAFFVGALLLVFAVSVARPFSSKWIQLAAWIAFLPLTYGAFLGISLFFAGTWPCMR